MSAPLTGATTGVIGAIALALAAPAAPASAGDLLGPDVVVHFGDLDLNTRPGAEKLYARIEGAAAQVCRIGDTYELAMHTAAMRCRDELVARTVAGIQSAQLAAVYATKTHPSAHSPV